MIDRELTIYSLKNITNKKARSILTIGSIFIGIISIYLFVSFGWGLFDYVNELKDSSGADIVTVTPKGTGAPGLDTTFYLSDNDVSAVKKTPGVFEATPTYAKVAEVSKRDEKKFVFIFAYNPKKPLIEEVYQVKIFEGRKLNGEDIGKVVLGYNYRIKDKIFSVPIRLNDQLEVQGQKVRVVGFFDKLGNPQDDSNIFISNDFFEKLYQNNSKKYSQIIAKTNLEMVDKITENIEKSLRSSRNLEKGKEDFFVASFQELIEQFTSVINYIVYFVVFIAFISVIVSGINTSNTMITSVLERVKEIGVMKAIGAKNSDVFGVFVFESGFLGFVAGIFGASIGLIITKGTDIFLEEAGWGFLSPHYSFVLFVGCVIFAAITGALSGIIPSWRASKIEPVRALRYE